MRRARLLLVANAHSCDGSEPSTRSMRDHRRPGSVMVLQAPSEKHRCPRRRFGAAFQGIPIHHRDALRRGLIVCVLGYVGPL